MSCPSGRILLVGIEKGEDNGEKLKAPNVGDHFPLHPALSNHMVE